MLSLRSPPFLSPSFPHPSIAHRLLVALRLPILSFLSRLSARDRYIITEADWKLVDEKGREQDRRKCHLFRQIYGQSVIPVFYPHEDGRGRKGKQILTEVMGHSDSPSSRKHAAESYDSDVFVVDIEAVKAACGR